MFLMKLASSSMTMGPDRSSGTVKTRFVICGSIGFVLFCRRAHTVTVLFLISSVLLYVSLYDQPGDTMYNMRR